MVTATYGNVNPRGVDPWPIEGTLAPLAVEGNKTEAQNMLSSYQMQRKAQGNAYEDELAGQHDFARQQLQQQMQENYLKALPELLGKPGGAAFVANGGLPGLGMLGGSPDAYTGLAQAGAAHDTAVNFEAGGKGYEGMSNAGITIPDANQIPGLQGTGAAVGENARIAAERIRAAAMIQAAGINAAGRKAASGDGFGFTTMITDPSTGAKVNVRLPKSTTPTNLPDRLGAVGYPVINPQTPPIDLPSEAGGPPTPAPTPKTNLPKMAPTTSSAPNNSNAGVQQKQKEVIDSLHKLPTTTQDDIRRGFKGGVPDVRVDANGQPYVQGASGKTYQ